MRRSTNAFRFAATFALMLLSIEASGGDLAPADQAKVRAVLDAYRSAWLANDAEAVLSVFADDAVLMPHHGVEPLVGKQAARAFWFPGGTPVTITAFTQAIDQVSGGCDVAYVRGHSKVEWVTGKGNQARRSGNAGTNLAVLRRQPDGSWRIAVLMWDDPPAQTLPPPR